MPPGKHPALLNGFPTPPFAQILAPFHLVSGAPVTETYRNNYQQHFSSRRGSLQAPSSPFTICLVLAATHSWKRSQLRGKEQTTLCRTLLTLQDLGTMKFIFSSPCLCPSAQSGVCWLHSIPAKLSPISLCVKHTFHTAGSGTTWGSSDHILLPLRQQETPAWLPAPEQHRTASCLTAETAGARLPHAESKIPTSSCLGPARKKCNALLFLFER